ncbi:hypothetical protein BGZ83_010674 [Gryganskiella cystojenkinii]|nr:hypothetical protein BGZ83_010674 [Gryganskiella cystojenkinii]
MSNNHNSVSNPSTTAPATGSIASNDLILEPPSLQADPVRFRIGGFKGTLTTTMPPAPSSPSVPSSGSGQAPVVGDVDADESTTENRSNEQAVAGENDEDDEDAKIRAERRRQWKEMIDNGELDLQVKPGKIYTLPVERPKLM